MSALTFNKRSWHFWLATKVASYSPATSDEEYGGDSADVCTYSRAVAIGLLVLSIVVLSGTFFAYVIIHTILGIYFSVMLEQWFFSEWGDAGVILLGCGLVTYGVYTIVKVWVKFNERPATRSATHDGFIRNAYKSWKEKFCVPVKFVD